MVFSRLFNTTRHYHRGVASFQGRICTKATFEVASITGVASFSGLQI